ncbi:NAD(P)H nitroreductase [Luedemannella flava]|uniref:NAD(P)H nitroreductase n=1 Tax=Luedemannella flava TaxID=349316 RepID=A0ABN2MBT9_9ACTN
MSRDLLSRASHLQWAAHMALRAPSVWNTQPWRWRVLDDAVELWADRERQVVSIDPAGLLLTLSCGTALHHLRTALAASGDEVVVDRLPYPGTPDLLARVSLRFPGVLVEDDTEYARFAAMARRRTDRRPFAEIPVSTMLLDRLRSVAAAEDTRLTLLDAEGVGLLARLTEGAALVEAGDERYVADLDGWTHRPRYARDGMPAANAPAAAARVVPVREFVPDADPEPGAGPVLLDRCASYALFWGEHDDPASWLRAGEALSAVLLEATVHGLATSPISNVVEVEALRNALRDVLPEPGHPYLALRIGWPISTEAGDDRTQRLSPARRIDIADPA